MGLEKILFLAKTDDCLSFLAILKDFSPIFFPIYTSLCESLYQAGLKSKTPFSKTEVLYTLIKEMSHDPEILNYLYSHLSKKVRIDPIGYKSLCLHYLNILHNSSLTLGLPFYRHLQALHVLTPNEEVDEGLKFFHAPYEPQTVATLVSHVLERETILDTVLEEVSVSLAKLISYLHQTPQAPLGDDLLWHATRLKILKGSSLLIVGSIVLNTFLREIPSVLFQPFSGLKGSEKRDGSLQQT